MLYQLAAKALSPILFGNQKSSGRNMRTATRHIGAVAVHAELSNVVARQFDGLRGGAQGLTLH